MVASSSMFDRSFIYFMDRIVWLILFAVMCNLVLDLSEVMAQEKDSENAILPETTTLEQESELSPKDNVEIIKDRPIETTVTEKRQNTFFPAPDGRIPFFDSIFNIPIATLQAVNQLVQSIIGGMG